MQALHLVFKRCTETTVESVVQMIAGPLIHVDIIPQPPPNQPHRAYTSYMFECFSENDAAYKPDEYQSLTLHISPEENEAARTYLQGLVERQVPYNYQDLFFCMLPASAAVSDIEDDGASALFCSQAVILCLRHCITSNPQLSEVLAELNSRTTTPNMLYEAIKPFAADKTIPEELTVL